MSFMKWIGIAPSSKATDTNVWPGAHERYYGLENFGNTCYCNSILQALFHCPAFRECVLNYPQYLLTDGTRPAAPRLSGDRRPSLSASATVTSFADGTAKTSSRSPRFARLHSRGLQSASTVASGNATASPTLPTEPKLTRSVSAYPEGSTAHPSASSSKLSTYSDGSGDTVALMVPPHLTAAAMGVNDCMFTALKDLFYALSTQKKRTGVFSPNSFIQKLRKENELFRSTMHQDAHEFLNYMLNVIVEDVRKIQAHYMARRASDTSDRPNSRMANGATATKDRRPSSESSEAHSNGSSRRTSKTSTQSKPSPTIDATTWVHKLFEGVLTNETKCLTCETVSSRDESFLDLSIDIENHSSVTSCLRQFSASEVLRSKNKFFCDECGGLQEAEKRMKIRHLPNILALHLKRFKYQEQLGRHVKLSCRVLFPFELRLPNTTDNIDNPDRLYSLFAVCIHIGSGPSHGHYISVVKSHGQWILFDDDTVTRIAEDDILRYFGDHPRAGSGYLLFYQAEDLDPAALDLPHLADPSILMDHGLQAQDSPKAPTPGAMGKDTADGPWRPASPSPGEGRATANGPDPVRLAKRTSSLIVPGPSMALDYAGQSLGATTEGQLSQSDHGSPRLPTSDLPPDQPAKIPPFSSIITSDLANARSPLSAGSLSTSAWEQPPRLPLPALPRSPSRAYTKDDSRSAVIVPSAQMPPVAAHRSRPTRAEMLHAAPGTGGILPPMVDGFGHALPGSVNLGTESSRFATNGALGNHPPSPFYASPSAPSSRSQSPAPPGSLLSTTATASSTPRGNMSLEVPLASRLSTSTAVSPTAAAPHSAAPTMGSTTATGVGSGATFANPSSWFTRRNSQTAAAPTTKHKESFTNKFWKPIQTKQR